MDELKDAATAKLVLQELLPRAPVFCRWSYDAWCPYPYGVNRLTNTVESRVSYDLIDERDEKTQLYVTLYLGARWSLLVSRKRTDPLVLDLGDPGVTTMLESAVESRLEAKRRLKKVHQRTRSKRYEATRAL